ncbi:unnamed protein product [Schistosoma margrebowiei]|uniref:Uncharacterized protein n=1 Tax=Schistosoma margrebowiei TaxID=48269 RepID=A0A183NCV8_9TREM|nr:unnamed protein product [Schistosoma margrebowiei]
MMSFRRTMNDPRPNDPAKRTKLHQNHLPELLIFYNSSHEFLTSSNSEETVSVIRDQLSDPVMSISETYHVMGSNPIIHETHCTICD